MSRGLSLDGNIYTAAADSTYVSKPYMESRISVRKTNENKAIKSLKSRIEDIEQKAYQRQKETITQIIKEHPRARKNVNADEMADMIIKAGRETGVDPIVIAHIAGQETGYEQNVPTNNGSGIMQLVTITIKDMYQRPNYYGGNIKSILDKYKTPEKLMEAARKDPQLNLILGAYCFKAKNKLAKGDLKKALEYYNSTSLKYTYSNTIYARVQKARESQTQHFENIA